MGAAALVLGVVLLLGVPASGSTTTAVTTDTTSPGEPSGELQVDGSDPNLALTETGIGTLTVAATITGVPEAIADEFVTIAATITQDGDTCEARELHRVAHDTRTSLLFTFPAGCQLEAEPARLEIAAIDTTTPIEPWATDLRVAEQDAPQPFRFTPLLTSYGIGLLLLLCFGWWLGRKTTHPWNTPLDGLSTTWKWGDSPITNVTLAAAVFTAALGTADILKVVLGTTKDSDVAAVVVAAALTTGIVGAAPVALAFFRHTPDVAADRSKPNYTAKGVAVATGTVVLGHVGLIGTVAWILIDAPGGVLSARTILAVIGIVAAVVVFVVALKSLRRTIEIGQHSPEREKKAELIYTFPGEAGELRWEVLLIDSSRQEVLAATVEADNAVPEGSPTVAAPVVLAADEVGSGWGEASALP